MQSSPSELQILALLSVKENYDKYYDLIKNIPTNTEIRSLIKDINEYYVTYPSDIQIDWNKFRTWFKLVRHPAYKPERYAIIDIILDNTIKTPIDPLVIKRFHDLNYALKIMAECDRVAKGTNDPEIFNKIKDLLNEHDNSPQDTGLEKYFVTDDLVELVKKYMPSGHGIEWRLEELNRSVGPVHHSDFIVVGKRPETGGTSFMLSEFTYMLHQLPEGKHAIIFNNEEGGYKIKQRIPMAALNISMSDILTDPAKVRDDFNQWRGDRRIEVVDKNDISIKEIERILSCGDYWLIGINVMEKLRGFDREDDIIRRQKLAQWCRSIANKYGVVLGIVQADASAENQRKLNQNQLYGSKTGVQGEIDVLIMIGKVDDPGLEDRRFLTICKNKKPETGRMERIFRHGHFEVLFDGDKCRYESLFGVR
jgi:hypothetical protein